MTPYYAVIFTSRLTENTAGYTEMAHLMESLAKKQPGYLGFESAREDLGISISYWKTLEDIQRWKEVLEHKRAQQLGIDRWYAQYTTRVCRVEREYAFKRGADV